MRKSLKKVWICYRKTWRHFKKRFWKRSKSNKGFSTHQILLTIGFSLILISVVGFLSTRTAEVTKVGETNETTTTTIPTTTSTTPTIETTTTITTTIPRTSTDLENDLKGLGYHVTYVERNEEKWQFGKYENYVLVVIKQVGLIPEMGHINKNQCQDISEDVDFLAQENYPDSDVWLTIIFSKCRGRYVLCLKSVPELGIKKYCSEMHNLPQKYC